MEQGKIYSAVSAGFCTPGVYGYFSDTVKNIRLMVADCSLLVRLRSIADDAHAERFICPLGTRCSLFMPVCSEKNVAAFEHFRAGGSVRCGGKTYSKEDCLCTSVPFLSEDIEIVSLNSAADVKLRPYGTVQELFQADAIARTCGVLWLVRKSDKTAFLVHEVTRIETGQEAVCIGAGVSFTLEELCNGFTFRDGAPCGKNEE